MYTLRPQLYVYAGLTKNFSEDDVTKVFGITKVVNNHGNSGYDDVAYLAQFRINPDSTVALLGFMYGPFNQFVRDAGIGEAEGWIYGTALPSEVSRLRRFESISNATDNFDIARFTAFLFGLQQDLGSGIELSVRDLEIFYNIIERQQKGRSPFFRVYVGGNFSQEKLTGIPFVGTSKTDSWKGTVGLELPIDKRSIGLSVSYKNNGEYGVLFRYEF